MTIVDVAKHVGVSVMTVSRALNGNAPVAQTTRDKILAAVAELGYVANITARRMRSAQTGVLGFVVSDLRFPYMAELIGAASTYARSAGYDMLVQTTWADSTGGDRHVGTLLSGLCDGLLIAVPNTIESYVSRLRSSPVPVVLLNYWRDDLGLPTVRADNLRGAYLATRHLLDLGHQRIAFIAGTAHTGQSKQREEGWRQALAEAGIQPSEALLAAADFTQAGAKACAAQLLARQRGRPTAIFAANDLMAVGVIEAARERGLRIPEDLSVVGFDDIPLAEHLQPPLTTVRHPFSRLSEEGIDLLLKLIAHEQDAKQTIELDSELIVRASTGPAPRTGRQAAAG